jgi:hypothetical protein
MDVRFPSCCEWKRRSLRFEGGEEREACLQLTHAERMTMQPIADETRVAPYGIGWHVNWSAVWIGALAAIAAALVFGLIGTAAGATSVHAIASWHTVPFGDVAAIVCAGFFSMAAGGWAAAKVTALKHAEPAILHAVVAWLVTLPAILLLLALGAGTALGGWYGGLVSSPFAAPAAAPAPDVLRNTALTTLLVGLAGAVIGGWIASGEPMTLTHHRTRRARYTA